MKIITSSRLLPGILHPNPSVHPSQERTGQRAPAASQRGSVLIIVLWIAFGLVSLALYFGNSMFLEFRAADNYAAGAAAEQAIEGAARYVIYTLTNQAALELIEPGVLPDVLTYETEEVPLGEGMFWLIGRSDAHLQADLPYFGLADEASKLNLNTATLEMLQALPGMTPQFAAAIVDWRDEDNEITPDGAESETYSRRNPSYLCKNAPFETVEELRLVFGADVALLYGEDYNRNGILDPNENDGELSPPYDNRDGRLEPGLIDYFTVLSRESSTRSDGSARIDVNSGGQTNLTQLLSETFGEDRGREIQQQIQIAGGNYTSLLEFYLRSGMTSEEFAQIEGDLAVTNATVLEGLVNVNTASEAVLACIPGIGPEKASELVAHRQSLAPPLKTMAWVASVLDAEGVAQAGPYLTSRSYQITADIAAVGRQGRGYRRTQFVIDLTEGSPKVIYRRDLSRLGWALGLQTRERLNTLLATTRTYSRYR